MIAFRLAVIMVADAVDEDRQHRPGHEEQRNGRKRVDLDTDLEESITGRQPVDAGQERMLAQMLGPQRLEEYNHAGAPGEQRCSNPNRMAEPFDPVGEQDD